MQRYDRAVGGQPALDRCEYLLLIGLLPFGQLEGLGQAHQTGDGRFDGFSGDPVDGVVLQRVSRGILQCERCLANPSWPMQGMGLGEGNHRFRAETGVQDLQKLLTPGAPIQRLLWSARRGGYEQ